jgi:shikimate kinase
MAAGKSTVGPLLARALGWRFRDLDVEIERHTGATVPELFRTRGERAFRALEQELTAGLLQESGTVIAPGGGWAASAGALEQLPGGVCAVWLRVSAEEAVRRALASGQERPLLAGRDPLRIARDLLGAREASYARAAVHVDVDGRTPQEVAAAIIVRLEGMREE